MNAIADKAIARNTGARGLRSIIEDVMMDVMFDVPSDESYRKSNSYEGFCLKARVNRLLNTITIRKKLVSKAGAVTKVLS